MDWLQFTIFFTCIISFIINISNSAKANHQEIRNDLRDLRDETKLSSNEMKDFHGRLCALEERIKLKKEE
jgi:hypothetical protein